MQNSEYPWCNLVIPDCFDHLIANVLNDNLFEGSVIEKQLNVDNLIYLKIDYLHKHIFVKYLTSRYVPYISYKAKSMFSGTYTNNYKYRSDKITEAAVSISLLTIEEILKEKGTYVLTEYLKNKIASLELPDLKDQANMYKVAQTKALISPDNDYELEEIPF